MLSQEKKVCLVLADGTVYEGYGFGAEGKVIGEVVFATSMVGYQETLTDPSYFGQIVVQTFPLIGNYGINIEDYESEKCRLSGYIVREHCDFPSNFRNEQDLDSFLKQQNIIGLFGIDTRSLTRKIREKGVMNGAIISGDYNLKELLEQINAFKIVDAVKSTTISSPKTTTVDDAKFNVVLMDFGYKYNIERMLLKSKCNVTVVPSSTTASEILALNPDGIMLSNGAGDPEENVDVINTLKELIPHKIPTFGICLGHQLLALANGGKTKKLKYGHRGANQPVKDLDEDRTYITSQNHGYAVVGESIPSEVGRVSHINANDNTCEGVRYTNAPAFTVQFHPEACGGPLDTMYLFDKFVELMEGNK